MDFQPRLMSTINPFSALKRLNLKEQLASASIAHMVIAVRNLGHLEKLADATGMI
jgi:hypothetical protein